MFGVRKYKLYNAAEVLLGMHPTDIICMSNTRKELRLMRKLYGPFENVDHAVILYGDIMWIDVPQNIDTMTNEVADFQLMCKNMPRALKSWHAYDNLKVKIEGLFEIVRLVQSLSNNAMRDRHWQAVEKLAGAKFDMCEETFRVGHLLEADLLKVVEDVEEVSQGASNELDMEMKLHAIQKQWSAMCFSFSGYKGRNGIFILEGKEVLKMQITQMSWWI